MERMHDAPQISPENKDSDRDIFAALPKVTLHEHLPMEATTPAELADAVRAHVSALAADGVVYAELRLSPEAYPFAADAAVDAAVAALDTATADAPAGIDARLVLTGMRQSAFDAVADLAIARRSRRVVGFELAGDPTAALPEAGELGALTTRLRAGFVPFELHCSGGFDDVVAGVAAGVTRLSCATDIVDDFSADLDGITPGDVSAWVRDRGIAVTYTPSLEVTMGQIDELADHPLPLLQQLGFTCTIAAGKPEAGTLTDQFVALNETFGYGLEEFFDLTVKAIENSFASEEDRQRLLETVILPAYEELADPEFAEDALEDLSDAAAEDA